MRKPKAPRHTKRRAALIDKAIGEQLGIKPPTLDLYGNAYGRPVMKLLHSFTLDELPPATEARSVFEAAFAVMRGFRPSAKYQLALVAEGLVVAIEDPRTHELVWLG